MNADSRVPTRATSNAPSRRPRGSSVRTRGSHTPSSSARHQRHFSLQTPQEHQQQQQPHGFNNHPHLEGLPNCLCTACHIKGEFFPRREDGRIVLPLPWLLPSRPERLYSGPVAGRVSTIGGAQIHVPSAQQPGVQGYRPGQVDQGLRVDNALMRNVHVERDTDRGEGSSRGGIRLSGPGVAPVDSIDLGEQRMRRNRADRSKSRHPKPYERRLGHDVSPTNLRQPISHLVPQPAQNVTWNLGRERLEPSGQMNVPQPNVPGPSMMMLSEDNPARQVYNLPETSQGFHMGPVPSYTPLASSSRNPLLHINPSSSQSQATLSFESSLEHTSATHSNFYSQPSQSSTAYPPDTSLAESSQTDPPQPPSAGVENVVRFQDPVIYDDPVVSSNLQAGGHVAIKWDSERKRRQGYFSQAGEGSEKSNFRHYNQSKIG